MKEIKIENAYCPVTLEPELEEMASLWPAAKRFEMAQKFRRWARQLKVSALIMSRASSPGKQPPSMPRVALRKAALN